MTDELNDVSLIPLIEKDDLLGILRGSKVLDNLTMYKNLLDPGST